MEQGVRGQSRQVEHVHDSQLLGVTSNLANSLSLLVARGNELRKARQMEQAIHVYLELNTRPPQAALCRTFARSDEEVGNIPEACQWAVACRASRNIWTGLISQEG